MGYFCDQLSDMQTFEQSADTCRYPASKPGIFGIVTEVVSDILVAESMEQMVTSQNGFKKPHIVAGSRIETGITSLSDYFSLGEPFYLFLGRRGVVDDRDGLEIPYGK
ncbi:MAG: hypothetical protein JW829_19130 [Pirellulales bacterium]|nr:hypothetical protein [Pirellulales bacterium]